MKGSYKIEGKITRIGETEAKSATFSVREIVVMTDDPKYPQPIPIQFVQDKTALLDGYSVGDSVSVDVNMRGREWNDRVFLNLDGWRIARTGQAATAPAPAGAAGGGFDADVPFAPLGGVV